MKFQYITLALIFAACGTDTMSKETSGQEWTPTFYSIKGWLTPTGPHTGTFVGQRTAKIPTACDGELATDSNNLTLADWTAVPREDAINIGMPDQSDGAELAARPGLAKEPTPIFRVSVTGRERRYDEDPSYDLFFEVRRDPVYLNVCDTVFERGHCHVPTSAFVFDGCSGVEGVQGTSLTNATFESMDTAPTLSFNEGAECGHEDILDAGHPKDLQVGRQVVSLLIGALEDGEEQELTSDKIVWKSSYRSSEECVEVLDLGDVCSCTWSYRESIEIARGWVRRDGDHLLVDIRGSGETDGYLLWGKFPIAQ